jgi:hypothetical protein
VNGFAVEQWSREYGTPLEADADARSNARVDESVEVPAERWGPVKPDSGTEQPGTILFVDGVQRIDAWVWVRTPEGDRPGICASFAAGAVRCDGRALVVDPRVGRGLFTPVASAEPIATRHGSYPVYPVAGETSEDLRRGLQRAMLDLEIEVAGDSGRADLVVVDGPLRGRQHVPGAIGYIKTHHAPYLSEAARPCVAALAPGERTPLFLITDSWTRYSWYLRLPGAAGHEWAGVVRCEATADHLRDATRVADLTAAALPRFASAPHKDARAPQNLAPIGALERRLRHLLGDPRLLFRALRVAAATPAAG